MSGLRALAYHAITALPLTDPDCRYGVPLAGFQAQIEQLAAAGYTFIDVERMLASLAGRIPLPDRAVLLTFDDCYVSLAAAARWLAREGIPGVAFAISGSLSPRGPVAGTFEPLLDRDGLSALVDAGLEIGAHGHSHRPLPDVAPGERADEIRGSVARLTAAGLGPVRLFAYPYGVYDRTVRDEVCGAGAAAAMTVAPGFIRPGDDPFALRRVEVFRHDTGLAFRLKVNTGGGVARLRAHLRLRTRLRRLRSPIPGRSPKRACA